MIIKETKSDKYINLLEKEINSSYKLYQFKVKLDIYTDYYYDREKTDFRDDEIREFMFDKIFEILNNGLSELTRKLNTELHKNSKFADITVESDDMDVDFINCEYIWYFGSLKIPTNLDSEEIIDIITDTAYKFKFTDFAEDELDISIDTVGDGYFEPKERLDMDVCIEITLDTYSAEFYE